MGKKSYLNSEYILIFYIERQLFGHIVVQQSFCNFVLYVQEPPIVIGFCTFVQTVVVCVHVMWGCFCNYTFINSEAEQTK